MSAKLGATRLDVAEVFLKNSSGNFFKMRRSEKRDHSLETLYAFFQRILKDIFSNILVRYALACLELPRRRGMWNAGQQ